MFSLLVDYAKMEGLRSLTFPCLRIISSSGAPLQLAVKTQVENLFGMVLHNGYGVTECSPTVSQAVVGERRSDTSVGKVLPGVEVQLVGSNLKQVADGEVGELWVRGSNVMKGYYRAKETALAINHEDGSTLDRRETDISLYRGRRLIIPSGDNVYPAEVESCAEFASRSCPFCRHRPGRGGEEGGGRGGWVCGARAVVAEFRSRSNPTRRATSRSLQAAVAHSAGFRNAADSDWKSYQGRALKGCPTSLLALTLSRIRRRAAGLLITKLPKLQRHFNQRRPFTFQPRLQRLPERIQRIHTDAGHSHSFRQ